MKKNSKKDEFTQEKNIAQKYLDISGVILLAINAKEKVAYINEKGCEVLGYKKEEIIGKNWFTKFLPKRIRGRVRDVFRKLIKGDIEQAEYYENPILTKDGEERIISWHNAELKDDKGNLAGILSSGMDISEGRTATADLKRSEARYQAIVEDQAELICRWQPKGRLTFVNSAYCRYFQKAPEELIGHTFMPLIPKEDWKRVNEHLASITSKNPIAIHEHRVIAQNGEIRWMQWTNRAIFDEHGRLIEYQSVGHDITERKKAEEALRESEERFRQVVANALEWVWEVDATGLYTYASPVVEKILGYKPDEIVGKKCFYDFFEPSEREELKKAALQVFSNKANFREFVNQNVHKSGRTVWLSTSGMPILDEEGNLVGYRGADTDITERRKSEEKLEILNKHLIKTNKKLYLLALRDYQTGLYNYRYLEDIIDAEFQRAKRYVNPLSVIMIDIDYFKSINEMYGPQCGDLILKQLARQLKKIVRKYDVVIRFSGEEFVIICPSTPGDAAVSLANRILSILSVYAFGTKNQAIKLKLSIGVAFFPDIKALKGMDLIDAAEKVVKKAKADGGHRVRRYTDLNKKTKPEEPVKADVRGLTKKLDELTKQSNQNLVEAIFAFAKTIELKDHYTGEHVEKTVHYATELAKTIGLSPDEIERIRQAAILHDLGKIGISDKILLKKSKLTKKEFELIKSHPQIAVDILRPIQVLHDIIPFIFYHHERWDGTGYPSGLKGEEIPMGARIIALADVYQALSSDRAYRKAFSRSKVKKIIKDGAGTQFDPKIVKVFLDILEKEK